MHVLDGWRQVTCSERDEVFRSMALPIVASSLTDPEGRYGDPVIFTEWADDADRDAAVLRDYLPNCTHFVPDEVAAQIGGAR